MVDSVVNQEPADLQAILYSKSLPVLANMLAPELKEGKANNYKVVGVERARGFSIVTIKITKSAEVDIDEATEDQVREVTVDYEHHNLQDILNHFLGKGTLAVATVPTTLDDVNELILEKTDKLILDEADIQAYFGDNVVDLYVKDPLDLRWYGNARINFSTVEGGAPDVPGKPKPVLTALVYDNVKKSLSVNVTNASVVYFTVGNGPEQPVDVIADKATLTSETSIALGTVVSARADTVTTSIVIPPLPVSDAFTLISYDFADESTVSIDDVVVGTWKELLAGEIAKINATNTGYNIFNIRNMTAAQVKLTVESTKPIELIEFLETDDLVYTLTGNVLTIYLNKKLSRPTLAVRITNRTLGGPNSFYMLGGDENVMAVVELAGNDQTETLPEVLNLNVAGTPVAVALGEEFHIPASVIKRRDEDELFAPYIESNDPELIPTDYTGLFYIIPKEVWDFDTINVNGVDYNTVDVTTNGVTHRTVTLPEPLVLPTELAITFPTNRSVEVRTEDLFSTNTSVTLGNPNDRFNLPEFIYGTQEQRTLWLCDTGYRDLTDRLGKTDSPYALLFNAPVTWVSITDVVDDPTPKDLEITIDNTATLYLHGYNKHILDAGAYWQGIKVGDLKYDVTSSLITLKLNGLKGVVEPGVFNVNDIYLNFTPATPWEPLVWPTLPIRPAKLTIV